MSNTLVCDGLEEAKILGWGNERYRVVTVDGILLTKSGTMTGGITGGMEARSQKWDDRAIEALKKNKERYESEMAELGSVREMQIKEAPIKKLNSPLITLDEELKRVQNQEAEAKSAMDDAIRQLDEIKKEADG